MTYSLQIDLLGGEKVAEILGQLKAMTGSLGAGGSIFGAAAAPNSQVSKQTEDVRRLTAQVEKGKVGVHALAKELKNLGETPGVTMFSKGGKTQGAFALSPSALARNPHLAAMLGGGNAGGASGGKFKGVYWSSKSMQLMQFPEVPAWIENMSGPSKSNFPPLTTKGLRDITGKDLAKVAGMGDINDIYNTGKMHGPDLGGILRADFLKKKAIATAAAAAKSLEDDVTFKKDMSFLMMPLFNPGSMWATLFGARQTFSALNTDEGKAMLAGQRGGMMGRALGGVGSAAGGGAMAATGVLVAGATAIGLALSALKKVVEETAKSFENARQLYSKALTNGMGLQFTAKRSLVANIMGVSETEVFRFGAQLSYLNPKLAQASKIFADTAKPLTQVSWEWKILETDLSATFAILANDATPAILGFMDALDDLVKLLNKHAQEFALTARIFSAEATGGWSEVFRWLFESKGKNDLAKNGVPSPSSWMKQLPAASWERMGLVMGPSTQNYAKETAHNTRSMARDLGTIAKGFRGVGAGGSWGPPKNYGGLDDHRYFGGAGAGGSWGMSPQQNAP